MHIMKRKTKTADLLTRDEWKTDNNQSGVDKTGNQLPESGDVNIMGTIYPISGKLDTFL